MLMTANKIYPQYGRYVLPSNRPNIAMVKRIVNVSVFLFITDCADIVVGRLTVQQGTKKSVRVCICHSSHTLRLWHVPI